MAKILIVDDSLMMRSVIKNYLKDRDFEFVEAQNGQEAFDKYKEHKPDLVFMDIIMPDIDGIQGSKLIKEFDSYAKIVVCSSVDEEGVNKDLATIGVVDRITKPFKQEEIIPMVEKYIK
jgi:two-component system chemotaxis response regulator CheY